MQHSTGMSRRSIGGTRIIYRTTVSPRVRGRYAGLFQASEVSGSRRAAVYSTAGSASKRRFRSRKSRSKMLSAADRSSRRRTPFGNPAIPWRIPAMVTAVIAVWLAGTESTHALYRTLQARFLRHHTRAFGGTSFDANFSGGLARRSRNGLLCL